MSLSVQSDYKRVLALKCVGPLNSLVAVCANNLWVFVYVADKSTFSPQQPLPIHLPRSSFEDSRVLLAVAGCERTSRMELSFVLVLLKKESLNPPSLRRDLIRYCSINKWWVVEEEEWSASNGYYNTLVAAHCQIRLWFALDWIGLDVLNGFIKTVSVRSI